MPDFDYLLALSELEATGAKFIVVGGVSAILNGAPVYTFDLDVVYKRSKETIEHLLVVLEAWDAIFRIQPHRRLRPNASHLEGQGHLNLLTAHGSFDLLATVGDNVSYEDLLPHTVEVKIDDDVSVRVLDLETLIALKEQLNGEKDRAVLPILRRTLAERLSSSSSESS